LSHAGVDIAPVLRIEAPAKMPDDVVRTNILNIGSLGLGTLFLAVTGMRFEWDENKNR